MRANTVGFEVQDVTGQKAARVRGIPTDASVGEMVEGLLDHLNMPRFNTEGGLLSYHPFLKRESRHLSQSELVGDTIAENDTVVLEPSITAGRE